MSRPRYDGFTLLELLVAISLAVTVIGLSLALYWLALDLSTRIDHKSTVDLSALRQLLRDLNCALWPSGDTNCVFSSVTNGLPEIPSGGFRLTFCATTPFLREGNPPWYDLERLVYEWNPGQSTLIRRARRLSGPSSEAEQTATSVLLVASLAVEFYDGKEWSKIWQTSGVPSAVRIVWERNGQTATAETFVATGIAISPRREGQRR